ncbi:ankyrin repeat-containing protein [Paramarasmius palmivorus]|uniref:Ankyrin repeat-containing protein n=1 Tax=Paramarasmius palmivorus TaxID=297713 RepID=A0AAW0DYH7_9AGAR
MSPTEDERSELLLSCRYGDLEDVQIFVEKYSWEDVANVKDENGNTVLHMTAANGHDDILDFILPKLPPSLLSMQNSAGSTALHWAALNQHLSTMKKLVEIAGVGLIDIKNNAGRSPLGESEMAGWEEGASWLVGVMNLGADEVKEGEEVEKEEEGEVPGNIEVEIQDADGGVAKMTISGNEDKS